MFSHSKQIDSLLKNITFDINSVNRSLHSIPAAYVIYHYNSGKIYVGSTNNLYKRISQHVYKLNNNTHRNKNLQKAFDKDKLILFNYIITKTKEEALKIEQEVIDLLLDKDKLFNISTNAEKSGEGLFKSKELKQKLSDLTKKQFSNTEARQKHSKISKLQWSDLNKLNKLEKAMKTRSKNIEFKKQLSRITKSLWENDEYRNKVSSSLKGRKIKSIEINGIKYRSILEASKFVNLSCTAIKRRLYSDSPVFSNYQFV